MKYTEFLEKVGEDVAKQYEDNMVRQMERNLRLSEQIELTDVRPEIVADIKQKMDIRIAHFKEQERGVLIDFLNAAFIWSDTTEGHEYWANIWKKASGFFMHEKESTLLFDVTWFPPTVADMDGCIEDHIEWKNQSLHQVIMMLRKQDYKGLEIVQAKE